MAKIAGGSVLSLRTFVERTYGGGAFDRVLDTLPPEERDPLRGIVLPVAWYPARAFVHALHATEVTFGDAGVYERYGTFAAEFEINTFQRMVLRFTSPIFFLDRAGRLWHRFHDSGEWEVSGDARHMRGTLRNFAIVDAHYCRVLTAWIKRAGEMTGVRGDVVHPECRALGAAACVFTGWWA